MNDDDYMLNDDDELVEDQYYQQSDDDEEDELGSMPEEEDISEKPKRTDSSIYGGRLTKTEIEFSSSYDDIMDAAKNSKGNTIEDAASIVVWANPKHNSQATIGHILQEMFHKQGHSRMQNSSYTPSSLKGEDLDMDLYLEDDSGFNRKFAQEARDQITRFIDYLANRDLSKDSVISRRRKERQLPAFIIFLFSSGMYDLVLNCPTMPKEYAVQVDSAFERLMKAKYQIIEDLAKRYEEMGRPKVAERVRKLQTAWFLREPAEIRVTSEYADLDLTYEDVVIYREYRSKFMNSSKVITQDVISDLIEVVIDPEAGIYEKLKDKTRAEAIADVKQVYKEWAKDNPVDSSLASSVIWKKVDSLKI